MLLWCIAVFDVEELHFSRNTSRTIDGTNKSVVIFADPAYKHGLSVKIGDDVSQMVLQRHFVVIDRSFEIHNDDESTVYLWKIPKDVCGERFSFAEAEYGLKAKMHFTGPHCIVTQNGPVRYEFETDAGSGKLYHWNKEIDFKPNKVYVARHLLLIRFNEGVYNIMLRFRAYGIHFDQYQCDSGVIYTSSGPTDPSFQSINTCLSTPQVGFYIFLITLCCVVIGLIVLFVLDCLGVISIVEVLHLDNTVKKEQ